MKRTMIVAMLLYAHSTVMAGTAWELKKDKDGIKIYTGCIPNTRIKAVRAEFILDATLSQLTALLLDVKAHEQWVYSTKTCYLIKALSASDQLYYTEISMPWPLSNRDAVMEIKISQQPATKVLYVAVSTVAQYLPESKSTVRVPLSNVNWVVTPLGDNKLSITYTAEADPGGDVPAWLVNSFTTKGPFETFKKLRDLIASPAYAQARFDFVKN